MKRFLSFLFIFACLLTIVPPAFAAETITVTAQVPPDWENANVYVWSAEGNGGEWPGEPMTKGADGRYTAEIPAGFTNIIINNKQGDQGIQTKDLLMNGNSDVWVVFDGTNASVHDSDPGLIATPGTPITGDLNTMHIVGSGIPGLNDWYLSDPNGRMSANGSVYTITFAFGAGTSINFRFCGNGSWDSGFNYGAYDYDTPVTAGVPVELIEDGTDLSYTAYQDCYATFTFDVSTKILTITENVLNDNTDGTVTVHARFPMTQSSPHLWAWQDNYRNDINAFDTWPGQPMTLNGDWWITQMPAECDNIIFNDGGMYQTPDTPVEAGRDIWAVVHSDWTVDIYYSAPDVPSGFPDELYIVGEGLPGVDAWDPYDHNGLMTGEDGVYQISFDVLKGSSMIFMFCGNGRWDSGYVYGSAANTVDARPDNYYLLNEDGGDFTYQASKDCTLTVTVDLANGYVTLREQAVETASHYTIHAKIHTADRPSLYAWSHDCYNMIWPGEKMYKDGDWYTLEISADNEYFNIVGGTNSTDDIEIPSSGTEFWVVCDSDWEYTISSTPPASSLPTVKFHVYAPDATKLSISFEETDDGIFHYVQMERSGKKGWWECTVFTNLGFTVNGDAECLKEHPLTLPGVTEETWVVLDEEGDHTVSNEEPEFSKNDTKKKSKKSSDEEVDDAPPVILFVLIGVGVVALAGIAVLVVLIIRKRR